MRNGEIVDTSPITPQTTTREIVEKMLGRSFEENFPERACAHRQCRCSNKTFSGADGKVNDVSFYVRRGEIVGIAGLVGAGKSELCKTIFGAYERTAGTAPKRRGRRSRILSRGEKSHCSGNRGAAQGRRVGK